MNKTGIIVASSIAGWLVLCVIGELVSDGREFELPRGETPTLMVLSEPLPQPLTYMARHASIVARTPNTGRWRRWEVMQYRSGGRTYVHRHHSADSTVGPGPLEIEAVFEGAEVDQMVRCLDQASDDYDDAESYLAWPGPNSNTYVDEMLRECDIAATLPGTAVGKDFRGYVVGASVTSSGTGIQLETVPAGLKLGLMDGVEVHVIGLSFGVDLLPPATIVPFGDGRIGFDDW